MTTSVPLQKLFFLNSGFVIRQAKALAGRLNGADDEKVRQGYRLLFDRQPTPAELQAGLAFLKSANPPEAWTQYAQVLLSSNEFSFVN